MKQIKFILTFLWGALYASSIWACVVWNGVRVGPNNFPILLVGVILFSLVSIVASVVYIIENWNQE